MMKQTFKNLLIAMLVLCTFVGVLPMIAAEDLTAQAAATTVYYDFKKGYNGFPSSAADKRSYFTKYLTYDQIAARNTGVTSGQWAAGTFTYSATDSSDQTNADNSYAPITLFVALNI